MLWLKMEKEISLKFTAIQNKKKEMTRQSRMANILVCLLIISTSQVKQEINMTDLYVHHQSTKKLHKHFYGGGSLFHPDLGINEMGRKMYTRKIERIPSLIEI